MQKVADGVRAPRYDVSVSMSCRAVGSSDWTAGRTLNVSRTGVLFTGGPATLAPGTAIELVLMLDGLGHPAKSLVHCRGNVVRVARTAGDPCAVAATFDRYRFLGIGEDPGPGLDGAGP